MAKRKVAPGFWWDAEEEVGYVDLRPRGRGSLCVQRVIRQMGYRDALAEYGRIRDEANRQRTGPRQVPTLRQYLGERGRLRQLRPTTARTYAYMLNRRILPEFGDLRLTQITTARVLEFRAAMVKEGVSPATANRHVFLLRAILNEARQRGVITDHPIPSGTLAALSESPPLPTYLSDDERDPFLAAFESEEGFRPYVEEKRRLGPVKLGSAAPAGRRYGGGRRRESEATGKAFLHFQAARPLFLCALDTGLARGDLVNLRWYQVDFSANPVRLRRSKTGVSIHLPMTPRLAAEVRALVRRGDNSHVFVTLSGKRWSETMIPRYFDIAKAIAGITRPFRFHDMRHDFASALAREGVNLVVIAQLLGHTTTRMTMRYAHLCPRSVCDWLIWGESIRLSPPKSGERVAESGQKGAGAGLKPSAGSSHGACDTARKFTMRSLGRHCQAWRSWMEQGCSLWSRRLRGDARFVAGAGVPRLGASTGARSWTRRGSPGGSSYLGSSADGAGRKGATRGRSVSCRRVWSPAGDGR